MRTIIVGDVHGCRVELAKLLQTVDHQPGRDDLVFVGDLLDRGPDPVGCVADAIRLGARRVRGNHEEKALRYLRHEARKLEDPSYQNPMDFPPERRHRPKPMSGTRPLTPEQEEVRRKRAEARAKLPAQPVKHKRVWRPIPEERKTEWRALTKEQLRWLAESPLYLALNDEWLVVHAGFEAGVQLKDQKDDRAIRLRYVDEKTGEFVPYADDSLDQPPGTVYWTEKWDGPQNVIYGHAVHSLVEPQVDLAPSGAHCFGIDTGCVYGGHLTAMILEGNSYTFAQVKAEREYLPMPGTASAGGDSLD